MACTEYKTIAVGKMENWVCLSSHHLTQGRRGLSLSHRWSVIRPHPVRRWKGRMCIVSPFDGVKAARPDLRYPPFSLTKLQRGRAFATCSLSQYGQITAAGALLVTSRRPSGTASSGLAHCPSSYVAACGSSLVVCLNSISAGVLSILQSRPQTIFDKPPCAIFPFLHGTCFFLSAYVSSTRVIGQ